MEASRFCADTGVAVVADGNGEANRTFPGVGACQGITCSPGVLQMFTVIWFLSTSR